MSTYGEMQDNIARVISRTDLTTEIQQAIQAAIRHYEAEPFWFNENTDTRTTTSSTKTYTLTADTAEVVAVLATNNGTTYELTPGTHQEMDAFDTSATFGQPSEWSIWNQQLRLYPTPDKAYTLTVRYQRRLGTLSATTDTNGWTTHAYDVIEARALWWLHTFKTRNTNAAMAAKAAEMESANRLHASHTRYVSTGRLKATQF
jgi:hypothetical protein